VIRRTSARDGQLYDRVLAPLLQHAVTYDRIAGYFSSSILPLIARDLAVSSGHMRVLCNDHLAAAEVRTARAARLAGIREEWNQIAGRELSGDELQDLQTLYQLLVRGQLEVRVLPDSICGFAHAKAGLVTDAAGNATCFVGSLNETRNGWTSNYEILWSDDSLDAATWFHGEFDPLWNDPDAEELPDVIVQDIGRVSNRVVISTIHEWRDTDKAGPAPIVDTLPITYQEDGLWAHQRWFINHACRDHQAPSGARLVLADGVGLGKTASAAIAAQVMCLQKGEPVLAIVPPTLLTQWQGELHDRLDMPSALWNGNRWIDDDGTQYGPDLGLDACPRQVALVSQGLFIQHSSRVECLYGLHYSCIIVDEAHKARRRRTLVNGRRTAGEKTNLMRALEQLAQCTHSMLMLTATPVQMDPIEAWDLLAILGRGPQGGAILGTPGSQWRRQAEDGLDIVLGHPKQKDMGAQDAWLWLRDPVPSRTEGAVWGSLRDHFNLPEDSMALQQLYSGLDQPERDRLHDQVTLDGLESTNPYVLHIVRRERTQLEQTIDPSTGRPCLEPIHMHLFGEDEDAEHTGNAIPSMTSAQTAAYREAQEFTKLLSKHEDHSSFLLTILLRRAGSSVDAGIRTAARLLNDATLVGDDDPDLEQTAQSPARNHRNLTPEEEGHLRSFADLLKNVHQDPKFDVIRGYLLYQGWLDRGCVIFSEYYDSAAWVARQLSGLPGLAQEPVGLYAGSNRSALLVGGHAKPCSREELRMMVLHRELRLLVGTDAASEGLNLQSLGCVINLDLPWNPTRLEQRKGRVQRSGQRFDEVYMLNLRYRDSIEDHVHAVISQRLKSVYDMFGAVPETIEDVWIEAASGNMPEAKAILSRTPTENPFHIRYSRDVQPVAWPRSNRVLSRATRIEALKEPWGQH